ncbi:MAG TPA: NADH-quinone oxidoreductase subunit L [Acidimicrobiales bacterium]|nr:NADH-quinone oxidoreductase subunit L [Acidimicrobiales bacterium]
MLNIAWLLPALPLLGFGLLLLFGRRLGDPKAGWLATTMVAGSFAVAVVLFIALFQRSPDHRVFVQTLFDWIPVGGLRVPVAFRVDQLSIVMALFVTGVSTLIHVYSIGYMHGDDRFPTFFVYLNLFVFSMLMLVMADNFLLTFLGWEGVGACSYFLVSFWFERNTAAVAGKKAFVTNRVGDFGFLLGMFLIFAHFGSLDYGAVLGHVGSISSGTATAIALLLFLGAVGKSAQIPLYIWLPDAMEGPTPVSALIHAATMVTAGVFLMARISPILFHAPAAGTTIAVIGAATAFYAATIACAQNDIKKVLAYSTISQLGYMFLAIGSGAYVAAIFHMVTHAFFKALLFLGAGSVMHGMHDEQNMKKMGALRKFMPITAATFIVAWLAIAGVPPFAGFWSKDEILVNAWDKSPVLWAVGAITALLTAYYMSRQVFLVFFGKPRWEEAADAKAPQEAEATPEHEPAATEASVAAAHGAAGDYRPHESPWTMALPLVVLALLSAFGGLLNLPINKSTEFLANWLEPVFGSSLHVVTASTGTKWALFAVTLVLVLIGIGVARAVYLAHRVPEERLEPAVLQHAWYFNDFISALVDGPVRLVAVWTAYVFDLKFIDGAVNGVATLVRDTGSTVRRVQTGFVRNYALAVSAGAVALLAFVIFRTA